MERMRGLSTGKAGCRLSSVESSSRGFFVKAVLKKSTRHVIHASHPPIVRRKKVRCPAVRGSMGPTDDSDETKTHPKLSLPKRNTSLTSIFEPSRVQARRLLRSLSRSPPHVRRDDDEEESEIKLKVVEKETREVEFGAKIDEIDVYGLAVASPPKPFFDQRRPWEARRVRVYLPPGYRPPSERTAKADDNPLPFLVLNDGQNLFDDAQQSSISGSSWDIVSMVGALIASGILPRLVIVGVNHAGPLRSFDYCPCQPGTGDGGFRPEAADWPGGGCHKYVDSIVNQLLPLVTTRYGLSTRVQERFFGGSSFGGICALVMGMRHPAVWGGLLVESPSLWIKEGRERERFEKAPQWPLRMYLAMGSEEYGDERGERANRLLVEYTENLAVALKTHGEMGSSRLATYIEEGGKHSEKDWARRLPTALKWLLRKPAAKKNDQVIASNKKVILVPEVPKSGRPAVIFADTEALGIGSRGGAVKLSYVDSNNTSAVHDLTPIFMRSEKEKKSACWSMTRIVIPPDVVGTAIVSFYDGTGTCIEGEESKIHVEASVENVAYRNKSSLLFTFPEKPLPGEPASLYMNRRASNQLRDATSIQLHGGYNDWELGKFEQAMEPCPDLGHGDWWKTDFVVPREAFEMTVAFSDHAEEKWDNNDSYNYSMGIEKVPGRNMREPRKVKSIESLDHAGGKLEIIQLKRRPTATRKERWSEEKTLRVFMPPNFNHDAPPPVGGYPVLYMCDAQNLFEDWLSHQGVSWAMGMSVAHLVERNELPMFIVVGIDGPVPFRSLNYCPYPPGSGVGNFRPDASRWPGGRVRGYMERIVEEIMPLITERYRASNEPERVAFGGASFGGVCALYASLHYSHVFSKFLVESPSLWIAEGKFLRDISEHKGEWPQRVFMGCGTREYSATRDDTRDDIDERLLNYCKEGHAILQRNMESGEAIQFVVEDGAGHHEGAWAYRLTGALKWLLEPWWHNNNT